MKDLKALLCSQILVSVSGQENELDVTNPHAERFFFRFEKFPRCGGLVQATSPYEKYNDFRCSQ